MFKSTCDTLKPITTLFIIRDLSPSAKFVNLQYHAVVEKYYCAFVIGRSCNGTLITRSCSRRHILLCKFLIVGNSYSSTISISLVLHYDSTFFYLNLNK